MKIFNIIESRPSTFIIASMIAGISLPYLGAFLNDYILYALIGIMLTTFLKTDSSEITKEFKKPFFLAYVLLIYVLIIPIGLFYIMKFIAPELCVGFLLFASLPPAIASPALTNIIKGNSALSLTIMTLINLIVPFSMVGLFSFLSKSNIELNTLGMFRTLILVILVPLLITQILKHLIPKTITKIKPSLGGLSVLFVMFIMYTVVAFQADQIIEKPFVVLEYLGYLYAIFFSIYLIGYFIAPWRSKKDRIALATTKTYPNTGLGVVLAFKFFTPEIALLLVIAQIPWGTSIGIFKGLNKYLK